MTHKHNQSAVGDSSESRRAAVSLTIKTRGKTRSVTTIARWGFRCGADVSGDTSRDTLPEATFDKTFDAKIAVMINVGSPAAMPTVITHPRSGAK